MSMYMRRNEKGHLVGWSKLRFILDWCCLVFTYSIFTQYPWTNAAVVAFLGIPSILVAEQIAARIPFSEIMTAIQSSATWLTTKGAKQIDDFFDSRGGRRETDRSTTVPPAEDDQ